MKQEVFISDRIEFLEKVWVLDDKNTAVFTFEQKHENQRLFKGSINEFIGDQTVVYTFDESQNITHLCKHIGISFSTSEDENEVEKTSKILERSKIAQWTCVKFFTI